MTDRLSADQCFLQPPHNGKIWQTNTVKEVRRAPSSGGQLVPSGSRRSCPCALPGEAHFAGSPAVPGHFLQDWELLLDLRHQETQNIFTAAAQYETSTGLLQDCEYGAAFI